MASLQSPGVKHAIQITKTFAQGSVLTAVTVVLLITVATLAFVWFVN